MTAIGAGEERRDVCLKYPHSKEMVRMDKKTPTEATLEARTHGALRRAFPFLREDDVEHQTTFSIRLGTKRITVSAEEEVQTERGRIDILVKWRAEPLAIMELKRAGTALEADDEAQGLSYARLVSPPAPLVVVSNGEHCRLLETYTGKPWTPEEPSEKAFAELTKRASNAAAGELKTAVKRLMGTDARVWGQAIRDATAAVLENLSGRWGESLRPFVQGFLVPRKATREVVSRLQAGRRVVLVEGPPLVGKSNVLRELCEGTKARGDVVALFVEADVGRSICQVVADILAEELGWPVREEEARDWMRNVSRTEGTRLVLCVDGIAEEDGLRTEIADLCSGQFGPALQLVVAVDETVAERLVLDSRGRSESAIGRRAARVQLDALDDDEFAAATRILRAHRAQVMRGGEFAREYRAPWVLRAAMAKIVREAEYRRGELAAWMAPFMGVELLWHARERLIDEEMRGRLLAVAQAVIDDGQDPNRPLSLIVEASAAYIVRRKTLRSYADARAIDELVAGGYLRPVVRGQTIRALLVRTPELVATMVALVIAEELEKRTERDVQDAAEWLVGAANSLPLGDVVAAQAVLDSINRRVGVPHSLMVALFKHVPGEQAARPGMGASLPLLGGGMADLRFREDGAIELEVDGHVETWEEDGEDLGTLHDFGGWMILSHLAGVPLCFEGEGGREMRMDEALLHGVGRCEMVLHRPDPRDIVRGVPVHDVPGHGSIVCSEAGIVEPITMSMFRFLSARGEQAEDWVRESASEDSMALIVRMAIALGHMAQLADGESSAFGQRMLDEVLGPALARYPVLHSSGQSVV